MKPKRLLELMESNALWEKATTVWMTLENTNCAGRGEDVTSQDILELVDYVKTLEAAYGITPN